MAANDDDFWRWWKWPIPPIIDIRFDYQHCLKASNYSNSLAYSTRFDGILWNHRWCNKIDDIHFWFSMMRFDSSRFFVIARNYSGSGADAIEADEVRGRALWFLRILSLDSGLITWWILGGLLNTHHQSYQFLRANAGLLLQCRMIYQDSSAGLHVTNSTESKKERRKDRKKESMGQKKNNKRSFKRLLAHQLVSESRCDSSSQVFKLELGMSFKDIS